MVKELFIQGNGACAHGAIKAGCRFFAGYPITPSTEVAETVAKLLPKHGGSFIQMEDEIAAIGAIIGGSWAGLKTMTSTSGPGFSLMQENIGYAHITETPIVVVDVQRGGPSTGQPTMASQGDMMQVRWGSHGDYEPITLSPSSVQEFFDFTVKAFNLAEQYRIPVIISADEIIGHMREKIAIPEKVDIRKRVMPKENPDEFSADNPYLPFKGETGEITPMAPFGEGYKIPVTGLTHDERGYPDSSEAEAHSKLITRLCDKVLNNRENIVSIREIFCDDADTILISYGAPARSVFTAVEFARKEGLKVGSIKIDTPWPFPEKQILEAAEKAKNLIVVEMNLGQMVVEVERVAGMVDGNRPNVHLIGKIGGELHKVDEILSQIKEIS
jgi:2-oxoglutarate ferredoxin oxidoreductase subunit alpha